MQKTKGKFRLNEDQRNPTYKLVVKIRMANFNDQCVQERNSNGTESNDEQNNTAEKVMPQSQKLPSFLDTSLIGFQPISVSSFSKILGVETSNQTKGFFVLKSGVCWQYLLSVPLPTPSQTSRGLRGNRERLRSRLDQWYNIYFTLNIKKENYIKHTICVWNFESDTISLLLQLYEINCSHQTNHKQILCFSCLFSFSTSRIKSIEQTKQINGHANEVSTLVI